MTTYISCSCNRTPHCTDWGNNGLVCFGTCNAIAIYELGTCIGCVTHTLHRHRSRVNTVRWIRPPNGAPESELLSGSVDGTVIIWSENGNNKFQDTSVLDVGHVTFVDCLQLSDNVKNRTSAVFPKLLICTGSTSGELKLWSREHNADIKILQTILFGRKLPIYCRLIYLPKTKRPLLTIALEDASLLLYTEDSNALETNFVKIQSLYGHEDWIRCIDFTYDSNGNVFLASGSQDATIRLWKISTAVAASPSNELVQKKEIFMVDGKEYNVTLESVLCGHEGWIYGIHWQPLKQKHDNNQPMRLLSCSLDKSMIIWELDDSTGIWTEKVRVGEVGGNTLGFYGCKFNSDGMYILGYGYQGSFHIWKYSQSIASWIPRSAASGHFSEVVDLCWEPRGRFLITASADQTTRIHASWKDEFKELWHEIARPQVHGYDMTCLVMLAPYIYASGAEEKVVRVFTATSTFRDRLKLLANIEDFKFTASYGATVPSLGLTNKASYDEKNNQESENKENPITNNAYESPTEEELVQNTLWPELQKLYGHGYEIFCMTARHDEHLLATACKSTKPEYSAIILWNTDTWLQVQKLMSHQLTVTQMAFSPNDRYLLSVSRDRTWSLFKEIDMDSYTLIITGSKKNGPHLRIIWCCTWTQDSNYFATGSRDGKIGVWSVRTLEEKIKNIPETTFDTQSQSVTALCFAPSSIAQKSYILAIGYEIGCIEIQMLTINVANILWTKLIEYNTSQAHHLTVKRLMFRPNNEHLSNMLQLASCGSDHAVKIHDIDLSLVLINT